MFMELYYEHYAEKCRGAYWEDPVSLPFAVMIRDKARRKVLEEMLDADGFRRVVWENEYPCMYVNFTLKRYGRNVAPAGSAAINKIPMTEQEFMERVYLPWKRDENIRLLLENNYEASARIKLKNARRTLEENIAAGRADAEFIAYMGRKIRQYERYIAPGTT